MFADMVKNSDFVAVVSTRAGGIVRAGENRRHPNLLGANTVEVLAFQRSLFFYTVGSVEEAKKNYANARYSYCSLPAGEAIFSRRTRANPESFVRRSFIAVRLVFSCALNVADVIGPLARTMASNVVWSAG